MKKSILILSSSDSRHVYNYIDIVLADRKIFEDITIFNVDYVEKTPTAFEEYYNKRNIEIINHKIWLKFDIPVLKSAYSFLERSLVLYKHLRQKKYDYIIIHYCSWQSMQWVNWFKGYFKHIIPVFWGGDVLRNKKVNSRQYKKVYDSSDVIVLPNAHSLNMFNQSTSHKYKNKAILIQFPTKMVRTFIEAEKSMPNKMDVLQEYGFPNNRLIVICGHTATRAERYESMVEELVQLPNDIKNKCYFVFMMTYSPEEYQSYQETIERLIHKNGLYGCVLKEYLSYEQIQRLHYISDIHITNILTDALSCFLQEELLAGAVLIYGKWLNYHEIETSDFYAIPFENINELKTTFEDVVVNFRFYKERSAINKDGIIKLASEESILKAWNKYL